jgi:hypothetical protein
MKKTLLFLSFFFCIRSNFAQQISQEQTEIVRTILSQYIENICFYAMQEDIIARETVINLFENRNNLVYNDLAKGNTEVEIFAYMNLFALENGGYQITFEDNIEQVKIETYHTPIGENYGQVVLRKRIRGHHIDKLVKNILIIDLLKAKIVNITNAMDNIADNNLTLSQLILKGRKAAQNKDYKEAIKWFEKSVEQGDILGQTYLGFMYYQGLGVSQDYNQAAEWFAKAAEGNEPIGQNYLGLLYEQGIGGLGKNYENAAYWYLQAANQNLAPAQFNLAYMYERGLGVEKNYKQARQWYEKAAEKQHTMAQLYLGSMYEHGLGIAKNNKEAIKWYQKAALQGNKNAQDALRRIQKNKKK